MAHVGEPARSAGVTFRLAVPDALSAVYDDAEAVVGREGRIGRLDDDRRCARLEDGAVEVRPGVRDDRPVQDPEPRDLDVVVRPDDLQVAEVLPDDR